MTTALQKARKFYFSKFLPSVLPIVLVSPNVPGTNKDNPFSDLQTTPTNASSKVTVHAAGFNQALIFDAVSSTQVIISSTPVSSTPVSSKLVTATCTPADSYEPVSVLSSRVSLPISE